MTLNHHLDSVLADSGITTSCFTSASTFNYKMWFLMFVHPSIMYSHMSLLGHGRLVPIFRQEGLPWTGCHSITALCLLSCKIFNFSFTQPAYGGSLVEVISLWCSGCRIHSIWPCCVHYKLSKCCCHSLPFFVLFKIGF